MCSVGNWPKHQSQLCELSPLHLSSPTHANSCKVSGLIETTPQSPSFFTPSSHQGHFDLSTGWHGRLKRWTWAEDGVTAKKGTVWTSKRLRRSNATRYLSKRWTWRRTEWPEKRGICGRNRATSGIYGIEQILMTRRELLFAGEVLRARRGTGEDQRSNHWDSKLGLA